MVIKNKKNNHDRLIERQKIKNKIHTLELGDKETSDFVDELFKLNRTEKDNDYRIKKMEALIKNKIL